MSDLNVTCLTGRLTRDTELRHTTGGTAVSDLSIASNRIWSKDGEKQEETHFMDCVLWGAQAEYLNQYLTKGTAVAVNGRLQTDRWETDEGVRRSKVRLVVESINLLPKGDGGGKAAKKPVAVVESMEEEIEF